MSLLTDALMKMNIGRNALIAIAAAAMAGWPGNSHNAMVYVQRIVPAPSSTEKSRIRCTASAVSRQGNASRSVWMYMLALSAVPGTPRRSCGLR